MSPCFGLERVRIHFGYGAFLALSFCTLLVPSIGRPDGGNTGNVSSPTLILSRVSTVFSRAVFSDLSKRLFLSGEQLGGVVVLEETPDRQRYRIRLMVDGDTVVTALISRRQSVRVDGSGRYATAMLQRLRSRNGARPAASAITSDESAEKNLVVEQLIEGTASRDKK